MNEEKKTIEMNRENEMKKNIELEWQRKMIIFNENKSKIEYY